MDAALISVSLNTGSAPEDSVLDNFNCPKLSKILSDIGAGHLLKHFMDNGDDDSTLSVLSQLGIRKLWRW